MAFLSKFTNTGIAMAITLAFGFWLSRRGKPYNGLLFNIHKLAALAVVVTAAVAFYDLMQNAPWSALLPVALILAVFCAVTLFATGAMMSIGTAQDALALVVHKISPALLLVALAAALLIFAL